MTAASAQVTKVSMPAATGALMIVTVPGYSRMVLPGVAGSVPLARALAGLSLRGWNIADTVLLCLSELVTNAILHSKSGLAGGMVKVSVTGEAIASVLVQVIDEGAIDPGTAASAAGGVHRPAGEGGLGLSVVMALADECGTETVYAGRLTWCRIGGRHDGSAAGPVRDTGYDAGRDARGDAIPDGRDDGYRGGRDAAQVNVPRPGVAA